MPVLTNFTFGPVQPSETCLCGDSIGHCRTGQLGMSYDLSWINICISSMAMFFGTAINLHQSYLKYHDIETVMKKMTQIFLVVAQFLLVFYKDVITYTKSCRFQAFK